MPTANHMKLRAKPAQDIDKRAIADAVQRAVGSHLLQLARAQSTPVLPPEGFVKLATILKVFPVGESSWWAGVRSGRYPQPVHLGAKSRAWRVSDIRALIAATSEPASSSPSAPPSREVQASA